VLSTTVGQVSKRLVEPGLDVDDVPHLDAVLISHMHFDHLSTSSLERLETKTEHFVVPEGGLVYVPDSPVDAVEVPTFRTVAWGGLSITAVPVDHSGYRYGLDDAWMKRSSTGYVIEYHDRIVYFGGDTAYAPRLFAATRKRFPRIDLALLPIAPIHPRSYMRTIHMDPDEAVRAFFDLGARRMMPIHYGTFINSLDEPGEPEARLRLAMRRSGLTERQVAVLRVGEQRVLE
jgi:L-ascorbate metabolism protein UlaG (beta-lactamase superfamily)